MNDIIDLTYPIHTGMQVYPTSWHPAVEVVGMGRHSVEGRQTTKFTLGTHTGTHIDAPRHFIGDGRTIDRISLSWCIGRAAVVSFAGSSKKDVGVDDLEKALGAYEVFPQRLLVRFDWSVHWGKEEFYIDYPYFTENACRWLIDKGIRLLGMDTPSPDNPENGYASASDSPNHKLLLGRDVILIEYLCNLNKLKSKEVYLTALPLCIKDADGSPARVIAYDL